MVCTSPKLEKAIGADTQYSIHALTDEAGSITEGYQYDAYGRQTVFTSAGTDATWFTNDDTQAMSVTSAVSNPYGYTGRRYDNESEIWYFRNRYYESDTGRFVNRDPLGYVDGLNIYASYYLINSMDWSGYFEFGKENMSLHGIWMDLMWLVKKGFMQENVRKKRRL